MKVLYAIQGTGNGHLSRAMEIVPALQKRCDLDILISGIQVDLSFPFPVKYRYNGLSFIFGKNGGVDILKTYIKFKARKLAKEIQNIPIEEYDLVINDFEPVSAWAAHRKSIPCISLSNQCAIFSINAPRPKSGDLFGELILKYYAPTSAEYGFHFECYDKNIFTPIIRKEIRNLTISNDGHYTVYLPSYDDKRLIKHLSKIKGVRWQIFSKHSKKIYTHKNISIQPISNEAFLKSMTSCEGMLTGAGFGTTSEALFLKKKLLVIPMKGQYEQHCNAAALNQLGVPSIKSLKKKHLHHVEDWVINGKTVEVDYKDNTNEIIDLILKDFQASKDSPLTYSWGNKQIREGSAEKIHEGKIYC
jgi:uncharacterized protein (TIGR00661 family)